MYITQDFSDGTFGVVIILAPSARVALDLVARNHDTPGHLYRDIALVSLSVGAATPLRDLPSKAIAVIASMPSA